MDTTPKPTIVLVTNSSEPALELRGVERYSGGSGFCSMMFVKCHGFSALRSFYFSEHSFHTALKALRRMEDQLQGEARFNEDFEHEQFLQFTMRSRGHVLVTGRLVLMSEHTNCFSFGFETDQTCLAPLIHSLDAFV